MCVWRTVCAYGHLIVDGNNIVKKKKGPQEIFTKNTESGLCVQ